MSSPVPGTLADIERIEASPLDAYLDAHSSYEALLQACARFPDKPALRFFFDGFCYDPGRIPVRARLRALGALLRYRRHVARPYEECTFARLARQVTQTARLLRHYGVQRGDVVSLLLPNLPETLVCMLAAETVGVVNPVNPLLEPEIIRGILSSAGTRVLVTMGALPCSDIWGKVDQIRAQLPRLERIVVVRGRCPPDCIDFGAAVRGFSPAPLAPPDWPRPGDPVSLFHTGGTTGLPRLVRGTHRNKIANARMLAMAAPVSSEDVGLLALPMFHANAAINCLLALTLGMTTVVAGPAGFRTPGVRANFLKILAKHGITYFSAVPSIFAALLEEGADGDNLDAVRFAISAAAPLPVEVMRAFTARTDIRILEGYGQTEATVATCPTPYAGVPKPGSVGLRLPFAMLRIARIGDDNRYLGACAVNEIGNLLVRGAHVGAGYLNPEHDRTLWVVDEDGVRWLNSGDLARIDEDGYVWLTGRAKELIIRGGHNIDPRMIEEALQSHPEVAMAAAVGRPDLQAGEVPVAYVMLAAGAGGDSAALLAHACARIPERAAWPKAVRVVDELPLTAVGKVYKPLLVQWEQASVFREILQPVSPWLSRLDVSVRPHLKYGLLTEILVDVKDHCHRELVAAMVGAAMRPFAAKYELTLASATRRWPT